MNNKVKGSLMLLLTALIWGNGFVAQSVGMDYIGPYTFLCVRGIIGGLFLLPCIFILEKFNSAIWNNLYYCRQSRIYNCFIYYNSSFTWNTVEEKSRSKYICIQFLVSGIISSVPMFIFENPEMKNILAAYSPLLYAGIMSFGVAYTLQVIGQKYIEASFASLIMSLESVFAVLGGWIILGQALSFKEVLGTILMFLSIILAQIPINILKRK